MALKSRAKYRELGAEAVQANSLKSLGGWSAFFKSVSLSPPSSSRIVLIERSIYEPGTLVPYRFPYVGAGRTRTNTRSGALDNTVVS